MSWWKSESAVEADNSDNGSWTPDGLPMRDEPDQKERDAEQARRFNEELAERRGLGNAPKEVRR